MNSAGRKKLTALYAGPLKIGANLSNELRGVLKTGVALGTFRQGADKTLSWFRKQDTKIQAEIVLFGMFAILPKACALEKYGETGVAHRYAKTLKRQHRVRDKAAAFDRVVEMLDHEKVGDKLLGDCTKADLLRAAVASERAAGEMTIQAGFYRLMADLVPQGETVRTANDRGKIVALLTHQFKGEE